MGQLLSNKYLKYRRSLAGRTVETDRACPQCDYNLRGLIYGGSCPECGTPITVDDPTRDALCDAPVKVIARLCRGFWIATISLAGILISPFAAAELGTSAAWDWPLFVLALASVWAGGVWMITRPIDSPLAQRHGFARRSKRRIAAAWMQMAWPVLMLLVVAEGLWSGGLFGATRMLALPLVLLGLAGMSVLAVLLQGLADWTHDERAHKQLNLAAWGIPIATTGLLLAWVTPLMVFLSCSLVVLWIASIACFALAMFSLGTSVTWSVRHARERAARDRRLRERKDAPAGDDDS